MSQEAGFAAVKPPSPQLLAELIPIEITDDIDSIREKIHSGRAFLRVVAYPWGVEFDVCEVKQ
jgi:hypothetical protein